MKKIILVLLMAAASLSAEQILTNEEKIENTIAYMYGTTLRHTKNNVNGCSTKYSDSLKEACKDGYKDTDDMYKSSSK